ncbi:hypothetical protein CWE04_13705 [Thomasclavelia cocleata]|uniref:discoidin domain-containing protein n=1 Tax=Thomasclavelia cocleata TaxID=69824 RepID=UPI000C27EA83|nr:discoidin domain-containing protein [Thomasclavelia cocleata]MCR1960069.1 discoidin domain-containing protein [Thomasclavelia cocleata]NDO42953.1 hypothetical protein [Thomasclavelia cocleata]PJN79572.1 hypothetical protein CWE04_13705 [Thomasclavelia cocleata]
MKIFKRLICVSISLLMMISFISPLSAYAVKTNEDVNTYIGELIAYYRDYQDNAKTDILRILDKIKELDKTKYDAWQEIMNFWSGVNKEGYTNVGVLPDGLPQDDSLCIVILGFALNSDGTMKQELINRLQVGLDSAKKYPNSYVVVTGGGTASGNPNVTEGGLMGQWLLEQGLSSERLIIENRAPDTVGNAKNTYKILNESYPQVKSLAMVTSDYHIPRGSVLFFTQCLLSAYETGNTPLQMISNAGCYTGSSGYESISLQASGVTSIAGVKAPSKLELSKLNGLVVTQEKEYEVNEELELNIEAFYNSNYSRDISDLVQITNFDPIKGANQTITLTYMENGITITTDFNLSETEKVIYDNTYLKELVEEVENRNFSAYTKESVALVNETLQNAKNILALGNDVTKDELDLAYKQINDALNNLVKLVNIAFKMNTEANCNQGNAYKINDGVKNTSNYWASENNGNVASKDAEFIIDLDGAYDVQSVIVYPYWNGQRIYQYELYGSNDKINWVKIGENLSDDYATSNGFEHEIDIDESISYIKLKGIKTTVVGRPDINNIHIIEMEVFGQEKDNLAYLKPVTSSGTDTSAGSSQNSKDIQIVDGDRQTYWDGGNYSDNPWVTVDLEDVYLLDSLNIITYWSRNDRYYYYDIYTSIDGKTFTLLYSKTEGTEKSTIFGEDINVSDQEVYARYVKVVGKFNSANSAFHINELRVYGNELTNKTALQIAVEMASVVTAEDLDKVVPAVVTEFNAALAEANTILANDNATQEEVDTSFARLSVAMHMLEFLKGDKTELQDLVDSTADLAAEKYTPETWAVLEEALTNANTVLNNENAMQEEVDEAYDNLQAAINGLEEAEVVDKSLLEAMVNKVLGLEEDKYIASSWQAMLPELEAAQEVLGNEKATQAEVDEACDALTRAYLNLRLKPNKDLLADLINKANGLNAASYTANTWAVVENEVIKAQAVLEDPEASEAEVKAAKKALTKSLEGLEPVKAGDTTASVKTGDTDLLGIFASLSMLSLAGLSLLRRKED